MEETAGQQQDLPGVSESLILGVMFTVLSYYDDTVAEVISNLVS